MALRDFINRVKQGIEDVATLDVVTTTGRVDIVVDEGGVIDFDALVRSIQAGMTAADDSRIRVLAVTRQQFDKDVFTFVADGLSDEDKQLLPIHFDGVKAGQDGRENFIKLATGTLDAIIPG